MSDITRSQEAESEASAARVAHQRRSAPIGLWGVTLLVATEAALFGTMLSSYFYLSSVAPAWPPPGTELPEVTRPVVLTAVLVLTTVPIYLASRAARGGRARAAGLLLLLVVVVQAGYLAYQTVLFGEDLAKFTPRDHAYGSIYFTMLAIDHAHVLVGILLGAFLVVRLLTSGLTNYRLVGLRATALYLYFVNLMAVLVVLTQVSPSL